MIRYSVILVEPKYAGNVGSVARVMKNLGCEDLVLVKPPELGKDARKMATHAQDVLKNARVFSKFSQLKDKFDFLIATSAIIATDKNTLRTPVFPQEVKNSVEHLKEGKIGLVFGREDYGLLNEEIKECDLLVTIPTSEEYPTLNVAQAVGILLYELMDFKKTIRKGKRKFKKVNALEKKILLEKFDALVKEVYKEPRRGLAKKTFRTLIGRAFISGKEAATLTGIFRKAQEKIK